MAIVEMFMDIIEMFVGMIGMILIISLPGIVVLLLTWVLTGGVDD